VEFKQYGAKRTDTKRNETHSCTQRYTYVTAWTVKIWYTYSALMIQMNTSLASRQSQPTNQSVLIAFQRQVMIAYTRQLHWTTVDVHRPLASRWVAFCFTQIPTNDDIYKHISTHRISDCSARKAMPFNIRHRPVATQNCRWKNDIWV